MIMQNDGQSCIDEKTAYDFSFTHLESGEPLYLSSFKRKVMLIVNTASKCGFTRQYEGLETIYQTYQREGFVVIGVPSNDFARQEPADNKDIAIFCKTTYGVTFPMTEKQKVSGKGAHPFYLWAKETCNLKKAPKWNFHKYLINRQGKLIDYFHSTTSPQSEKLIKAIEKALMEPDEERHL